MKLKLYSIILIGLIVTVAANAELLVDFETTPLLPKGPSTYAAAGPMQTIIIPNMVTFNGGVILGEPTSFPAIVHASRPNLYATSGPDVYDLLPNITIDIDEDFHVTSVTGKLFNGQQVTDYLVEAYSGAALVDSFVLPDMPANYDSGFGVFSLFNDPITRVVFTPENICDWNYLIDDISFVPEPVTMILLGLGSLVVIRRRGCQ